MRVYNPQVKDVKLEEIIGLDTEFTSLNVKEANIILLSINNPIEKKSYVFDLNANTYSKEDKLLLIDKISKCNKVLAHNSKVDIGVIYSNFGILLRNFWCTMLASQLIDNGYGYHVAKEKLKYTEFSNVSEKIYYTKNMVGSIELMPSPHSLLGCLRRYLGLSFVEGVDKKRLQMSFTTMKEGQSSTKEQLDYACSDVEYLYPLYLEQLKHIEEREQKDQVKIENTLTPVIVKMEFKGCLVDKEKQQDNIKNWKDKLFNIEIELDSILQSFAEDNPKIRGGQFVNKRRKEELIQTALFAGCEELIENENLGNVNYSSNKQLTDIFHRLEEPMPTDDEGKTSFAEEPLKNYITTYPNSKLKSFINLLLDYREYSKLLSTYGKSLLNLLDKDGRIRSNYTQCFTNTGRLTSSAIIKDQLGINLANIPKNNEVRRIFIPDPGYVFVDSDMTGQEVILSADYSKEPVLLDAFNKGFDHHSFLASISYSIIFGKKIEIVNEKKEIEVDGYKYDSKKLRDIHKSALFSKIYLGGPKRIQNILNEYLCNHIKPEDRFKTAEKISKELDKALSKLIKYLRGKVDEVKEKGYVTTTKLGRRRYFDEPDKAYGDSANFDIQGTGAMAIKFSLIQIDKWLENKSKELGISEEELGWITMSIYDQNLVSLNKKYIDLAPEIQQIMADSLTYFLDELKGSSDLNIREKWEK